MEEKKLFFIIVTILFLSLFALRFISLESDPLLLKRIGDAGDEGYWIHNAKNLALFGQFSLDDWNPFILSPLSTVLFFLSFKAFGVGFFAMRFVQALFSCLILLLMFFFVKKYSNIKTALISVVLAGTSITFLAFNRLGLLETGQLFFLLLLVYLIGEKKFFLSGLAFAIAVLLKVSAILYLPAFGFLLLFELFKGRAKIKQVFYFAAALIPAAAIYAAIFAFFPSFAQSFFGVTNPGTTSLLNFFFILTNPLFQRIDFYLLFLFSALFLLGLFAKKRTRELNFLEYSSIIWLVVGLAAMPFGDFSDRRFFVFLAPMAILAALLPTVLPINFRDLIGKIQKHKFFLLLPLAIALFSFFNPVFAVTLPDYYSFILPIAFIVALPVLWYLLRFNRVAAFLVGCLVLTTAFQAIFVLAGEFGAVISKDILKLAVFAGIILLAIFYSRINITENFFRRAIYAAIGINILLIILSFAFMANTLYLESKNLGIPNNKTLAGAFSQELSLENKNLDLKIYCSGVESNFNKEIKPDYILVPIESNSMYCDANHFGKTRLVKEIGLFPNAFSGEYRAHLKLYEIIK
ncbi:MAG: glycosyltransferase family 39 protein [Candidatus ainarchaeum sp.]|nr:glycosyltransferase family 39 protein [Candidatus ainarchaeum sp.]